MGKIKSVLFVCTGNSCRSIMAEGLLKKHLKALGKTGIEVCSAGMVAMSGAVPTYETIDVMKRERIDVSGFRSTKLSEELIKGSDLILVMDDMHKDEVLRLVPEAAQRTYLLKKFGLEDMDSHPEGFSVPDPIGRPIKDYEYCLWVIKKEIERIAKLL